MSHIYLNNKTEQYKKAYLKITKYRGEKLLGINTSALFRAIPYDSSTWMQTDG